MKTFIAVLFSLVAFSAAHLKWSHDVAHLYTFSDYENQFGKNYQDDQEHGIRKIVFEQNLEKIRQINADPTMTWKAGVNHLTDRMSTEMTALFGYNRPLAFKNNKKYYSFSDVNVKDLPKSVDWREKGVVNEVRNQGACGSCWAFSATAVLESHIAIQSGKLLEFSEQQLVDCVQNPQHCGGSGGCQGATQPLGFEYVKNAGGVINRSEYQYTARDGTCKAAEHSKIATIEGHTNLPTNDYNALLETIATKGPVSISVAATAWQFYDSGIYNGNCGATINHAVVLVGYGEENGNKFWIIRNSWGTGWGEHGHIRVKREDSAADVKCQTDYNPGDGSGCEGGPSQITVCGICGMYSDSSIPFGGKLA